MSFFGFHKFVEVVFPSSFGSPDLSSCFDVVVQSRMPVEDSSVPSFFGQGGDASCHTPLQSSVYFNPAFYVVFFHVFVSFFRASFDVIDPIFFVSIFLEGTHHYLGFFFNLAPNLHLSLFR